METDPSVFNFYVYLRTHPLITRHALAQNAQKKGAIMLTGFRGAKSIDQVGSNNGRSMQKHVSMSLGASF